MSDSPEPQDDPEIAALLDFAPVPRKREVADGWTPELQREFIARLAVHGSPGRACAEMGKHLTGMDKLKRSPLGASFRAAWEGAVALAKRRKEEREHKEYLSPGTTLPTIDLRRKHAPSPDSSGHPLPQRGEGAQGGGGAGQILNEYGEWEDEESLHRRADEARDAISRKLLNARRLYLQEISHSPGKRAAFEMLTELPIDWERAERLEPQPDEPWRSPNSRNPDMILTAESGWSWGECGYGPDRLAELHRVLDEARAEQGLPPIESAESKANDG